MHAKQQRDFWTDPGLLEGPFSFLSTLITEHTGHICSVCPKHIVADAQLERTSGKIDIAFDQNFQSQHIDRVEIPRNTITQCVSHSFYQVLFILQNSSEAHKVSSVSKARERQWRQTIIKNAKIAVMQSSSDVV